MIGEDIESAAKVAVERWREERGLTATPEQVTIHGSHPAFGLLHQMHQTERELCRVRAEADGLRSAVDELTATIRKLKAAAKKLRGKK